MNITDTSNPTTNDIDNQPALPVGGLAAAARDAGAEVTVVTICPQECSACQELYPEIWRECK